MGHICSNLGVWTKSGLARDGTTKPVSRDQILRGEREQGRTGTGKIKFPCSADHKSIGHQPHSYRVDAQSEERDDLYCNVLYLYGMYFL